MVTKTKFHPPPTQSSWMEWCKSLQDLYQTSKYFVYEDIEKASYLQMRKWVLGHNFDGVESVLRNLLLDAMLSADTKSNGSEVYVPWFLWNDLDYYATRSSSQTYLDATLSKSHSEEAKTIFQNIFDNVGPLTKIIMKPSYEHDVVIKYRNSFNFPLPLDPVFHRMIGNQSTIEMTNPLVIMIEGAPETIGEINSLLQRNHESGRPIVLIARSFPEEISATLATNWLRRSLNILPIPYGNTIESINLAADMCAITKGELISPHFGDVISVATLNEDKWGSVERAEWKDNRLLLFNDTNVDGHIRSLLNKMKKIENEELQNVYRDRILCLSNDAIEVWTPKDNSFLRAELDALLKHYNGFVTSGLVETPMGPVPKCFMDAAKESAQSLRKEILNIGGFLVGVDDELVSRR